jgi:protein-L-isoaspartate(D-aspartate) O-methyltransferase
LYFCKKKKKEDISDMKIDTYRHKGLRSKLIEDIEKKGITDSSILEAMKKLPRHFFLDSSFTEIAYQDKPFPIGCGQTISQPYTVAFQTQLLNVDKGMRVLEIGAGSGYQACILSEIGAKVFTIERIRELYIKTKQFLSEYGYKPKIFYGDGYQGLPTYAPFDRILVTAGAPEIPSALINQLKPGGIMVIPLDQSENLQVMKKIIMNHDHSYQVEDHGYFRFVPLIEKKE